MSQRRPDYDAMRAAQARSQQAGRVSHECTCYVTEEKYWFRYGSAVEPGSAMEPNPDCPEHVPAGVIEPAVSAWDLLGIAPDFTGGLSVDDWIDQERTR